MTRQDGAPGFASNSVPAAVASPATVRDGRQPTSGVGHEAVRRGPVRDDGGVAEERLGDDEAAGQTPEGPRAGHGHRLRRSLPEAPRGRHGHGAEQKVPEEDRRDTRPQHGRGRRLRDVVRQQELLQRRQHQVQGAEAGGPSGDQHRHVLQRGRGLHRGRDQVRRQGSGQLRDGRVAVQHVRRGLPHDQEADVRHRGAEARPHPQRHLPQRRLPPAARGPRQQTTQVRPLTL